MTSCLVVVSSSVWSSIIAVVLIDRYGSVDDSVVVSSLNNSFS